jgi:hypothetical protein
MIDGYDEDFRPGRTARTGSEEGTMSEVRIRKQIYLPVEQEEQLKTLATEMRVSETELIRRALAEYFRQLRIQQRRRSAWEQEQIFIGQWIGQGPVEGQRTWTRSDLYD